MQHLIQKLFSTGKGIFASDASPRSLEKRFAQHDIAYTPQTRASWRAMLYTTPGLQEYISGVILFEEALDQQTQAKIAFPQLLDDVGIVPGIKVDSGTRPFGPQNKEFITGGIDDLPERLTQYRQRGALFTKWRAVFVIGNSTPSQEAISQNISLLVHYTQVSLAHNMLPIVEPEVLMKGAHDIDTCATTTRTILTNLFEKLADTQLPLEQIILKTNMVISGSEAIPSTTQQVAQKTIEVLTAVVPKNIAGVVFLSGGQKPKEATQNLFEIAKLGPHPWPVTFSFERALEEPVMAAWQGKDENVGKAQDVLLKRARLNSLAVRGEYTKEMEND